MSLNTEEIKFTKNEQLILDILNRELSKLASRVNRIESYQDELFTMIQNINSAANSAVNMIRNELNELKNKLDELEKRVDNNEGSAADFESEG